jgi:hypothetical protein
MRKPQGTRTFFRNGGAKTLPSDFGHPKHREKKAMGAGPFSFPPFFLEGCNLEFQHEMEDHCLEQRAEH